MKLFIHIPCYNEEKTLPQVVADLPREIPSVDEIYTLITDDGSDDGTVEAAQRAGIDYIVRNPRNLGLAQTFARGMESCLFLGADIIVNTDGDGQYPGEDIPKLVGRMLEEKDDVTVGCRDIANHPDFSSFKRVLQRIGNVVVRFLAGTRIPDTTSGFRAFSRTGVMRFSVMTDFSYTLETIIQAGRIGLKVGWVPVGVNPKTRESRLFRSNAHFVFNQLKTMLKVFVFYCPMLFFGALSALSALLCVPLIGRILYYMLSEDVSVQKFKTGSGVLLLFLAFVSVLCIVAGLLGSVLSGLRFLIADVRYQTRAIGCHMGVKPRDLTILKSPRFFRWQDGAPEEGDPPEYEEVTS